MPVISFDVWGTLISPRAYVWEVARHLAAYMSRDISEVFRQILEGYARIKELRAKEKVRPERIVQDSLQVLLEVLDLSNAEPAKMSLAKAILSVDSNDLVLDSSPEVLREVRKRGFNVVTIGNVVFWPSWYTRALLEKCGLSPLIDVQVYADEVWCYKPRPCIFEAAEKSLEAAGIEPRIVAHIGDNFREDFVGALWYGLKAVFIDREGLFAKAPAVLIPSKGFVIKRLGELLSIIDTWMD